MMRATLFVLMMALGTLNAVGQITRSTTIITEGRRYMVAFPQVWAAPTEKPLPTPMQLLLSARDTTTVRITTVASITDAARIDKVVTILPGIVTKVAISTAYMNVESQSRRGYGISVTGDRPFSVATLQAWQGNGETAQHLPVESWGTSYYSMNFYQDRYGKNASYKQRPGQILIISSEDSTVVTLTPTVNTEGGVELPSVAKGATQSVTLMKGETFLIKSLIDTLLFRDVATDLSGTYITSTKPIGVVSGHTKGAIMRMSDILPPTGMFADDAHFVRNNVHDVMYPTTLAGKSFVTIPLMYSPTRVVGQGSVEHGIDDDRGDVIRVVGLEDGTMVRVGRQDGSGMLNKFILDKGETRVETALEFATYWESDKPILMGQYGKSYAKILAPKVTVGGGSSEEAQGHPTVEAGMPMLQMVPSIDRWITHATFSSPDGMDDFVNIVFKANEFSKIQFDGQPLDTLYRKSLRLVRGTDYAYIRTPIQAGNHTISSLSDSVRWMAWNYASLDGLQQGRAFGTAVGINLSTPCSGDTLYDRAESSTCGLTTVTSWVPSSGCGSIRMIHAVELNNASLMINEEFRSGDTVGVYNVKVLDLSKSSSATVRTISASGDVIDRVVTYVPDTVTASKSKHDFGQQPSLVTVTDTLTIINPHTDRSVVVTDISMINNGPTFTLTSTATPFVLAAGASVNVIVSSRLLSDNTVRDTLVVRTECVDWKLTEYLVRAIGDTTTSVSGEAETPGLTFTITPQPIRDVATLTLTTIERGAASIELIDLLGNVITARTEQVTSSPQSFMIGGMNVPSGTYSVRVTASGRQATARIIIAH
ncbi:MAG: T9SS type A sorting domain-containing protein [Ignavibacteria bacterium]|nr:T9SS type A sorting domain-containing protein [Ignavibacteria bacterium]